MSAELQHVASAPSPMERWPQASTRSWPRRPCHVGVALLCLLLADCGRPEPVDFDAPEPAIPAAEAQSDFLDLKAGVEWLSFVPDPQREYPELYRGLDSDQRRRQQIAPQQPATERVVLNFDLPEGSKIWPVRWYGTVLMAIDLPGADGLSVAIGRGDRGLSETMASLGEARAVQLREEFDTGGTAEIAADDDSAHVYWAPNGGSIAAYRAKLLGPGPNALLLVVEAYRGGRGISAEHLTALRTVLDSVSIQRDLAVEGLPSHKCASTVEELQRGVLRYPHGTLSLALTEGVVIRKSGGGSTLLIEGQGASPWMMIRRLDETKAEGDLRARVRTDAYFSRRLKGPRGRTSAGYQPDGPPMVLWDFSDYGAEHVVMGVIKAGDELLAVEVINQGLIEGEARRRAREAALAMLQGATVEPRTEAPEFEPLIGWNIGTMGRDE